MSIMFRSIVIGMVARKNATRRVAIRRGATFQFRLSLSLSVEFGSARSSSRSCDVNVAARSSDFRRSEDRGPSDESRDFFQSESDSSLSSVSLYFF